MNARFLTITMMAAMLLGGGVALAQEPAAQQAPPAQAGAQTPQTEQARERLQQIKDRLQLTPEQTEQVRPIFQDEMQQIKALREKNGSDDTGQRRRGRMKMAREMRSIQQATDEKLKKILTPAQMDELKKIREEWRQQMRDRASQRNEHG